MSTLGSYPTRDFSETQKFLVYDPETQSTSLVLGRDLGKYITPQSTYVFTEQSRAVAQNEDYQLGALIQTAGDLAAGDNFAGTFLVVPGGNGDFPMANGNDLLIIRGDVLLREQLASNNPGEGSDLVTYTGTGETVTEAIALASKVTTQVFTSSGTWTKPAGCKRVKVTGIAGGGGGGGANITSATEVSAGGGGGAGGAFVVTVDVSASTSEAVTVGAGGVGSNAAVGGDGGDSSFGIHGVATGGSGGSDGEALTGATAGVGGQGGQGITGDIVFGGSGGSDGISVSTESNQPLAPVHRVGSGGVGGSAPFSAGGGRNPFATGGSTQGSSFSGNPATGYGGGGSGAVNSAGVATGAPGGNGGGGIVIITEFYL